MDQDINTVYYEDWFAKFCASISWRTLTYIRDKNKHEEKSEEYRIEIEKAELHLRRYLLGNVSNLNEYEQHIYPLDRIESTTDLGLP